MTRLAVVTTFPPNRWTAYAKRMLQSHVDFWPDDVEDLLPNGEFQDRSNPTWKKNYSKYVEKKADGRYSTLKTKKGGRFARFTIITDALHWTHIERPENVAYACMDFIVDN